MRSKIMITAVVLFALAAAAASGILIRNLTRPDYDSFAQCLTEKGVMMYGAYWCHACDVQKERFQGSFEGISYVECSKDHERCEDIHAFPTWEYRDRLYRGVHSIGQLEEITGCTA
ncbi:hypothetical protein GF351_02190 [Candidatus Woesearchaeota archaeon]|nr:hypothetical protein [Candidatus Woesearchaeota archaeon]